MDGTEVRCGDGLIVLLYRVRRAVLTRGSWRLAAFGLGFVVLVVAVYRGYASDWLAALACVAGGLAALWLSGTWVVP